MKPKEPILERERERERMEWLKPKEPIFFRERKGVIQTCKWDLTWAKVRSLTSMSSRTDLGVAPNHQIPHRKISDIKIRAVEFMSRERERESFILFLLESSLSLSSFRERKRGKFANL